jgi:hypothetical protein
MPYGQRRRRWSAFGVASNVVILTLTDDCIFGVQTFYFHHFQFWDRKGKKIAHDLSRFGDMHVHIKP